MTNRNRNTGRRNDKWAWKKPRINKGFWTMAIGVIALIIIYIAVKASS